MTRIPSSGLWILVNIAVLLAAIGGWALFSRSGIVPPAFFPGPGKTWDAIIKGIENGSLVAETGETLLKMAYGWVLASLVGVALGAVIGISPWARAYVAPMLEAIRPLPASAVAPVAIVLLGLTDTMIVALIAFGAVWPMLLTTVHGFANVHVRLGEVNRALGLSRLDYVRKIALPSAMPDILAGMRLGLTIALILTVVGEMITVQGGLGSRILLASRRFGAADIFAGVVLLGLIGFLTNALLGLIERRVLRWKKR
ncbi:MAG: ABC transporter permease [Pseudomonadota bacterium]|nr:ABC transporter permease [Pseudomonadota bacterium]